MKKLILAALALTTLTASAEAVSRRGVQRPNILQLIYPSGVPTAPAPAPPVVVAPTPTEPPAPSNIPTPIEGGVPVGTVTP